MPGLVDTHSHIGAPMAADASDPMQPECRVLDALDVRDAGIQKAQAGGITTANVMPGSGHLLSGQTIYIKLKDGRTIDDLAIHNPDSTIAGGMKMATLGRLIPNRADSRAVIWLHRYGYWALLFSWVPLFGDALCVGAGWLRFNAYVSLLLFAAGKLFRYLVVAGGWAWIEAVILPLLFPR